MSRNVVIASVLLWTAVAVVALVDFDERQLGHPGRHDGRGHRLRRGAKAPTDEARSSRFVGPHAAVARFRVGSTDTGLDPSSEDLASLVTKAALPSGMLKTFP